MAEIPIQHRKQGSKWWLWLLLALLVILAVWYFMRDNRADVGRTTGDATRTMMHVAADAAVDVVGPGLAA